MSSVTGVLGGTTEEDVMEEMATLMNADGMMVGMSYKIDWWKHKETNEDFACWGHPMFVQFRTPQALEDAIGRIQRTRQRRDVGGKRTLKLERSDCEFRLEPELVKEGGVGLKNVGDGPELGVRMSLEEGTDWFVREMYARSRNHTFPGDFEVMKTPARGWEVNKGAPIRRFKGGRTGAHDWE